MRVLMVSHTVLSTTGNMGKTLKAYLSEFDADQVAQFYIHSEIPTDEEACHEYYRFTDVDAVKSWIMPWVKGTRFRKKDIETRRNSTRVDSGLTEAMYNAGGRRGPLTMALREWVWRFARWDNSGMREWLREVDPDVVFYAAGDYMFTYRIARRIAKELGKPLVLACVDDFYFYNRNASSWIGRWTYRCYMREVRRTMEHTSLIFAICDHMARKYTELFDRPCRVLHTGAQNQELHLKPGAKQISYIGNLGLGRHRQLIELAGALQEVGPEWVLDVYSGSKDPDVIDAIKTVPGIRFHGAIPAQEVLRVMENSLAVIHTESFDERMQNMVRFSVSTKIAESLMYGPCMIAYGPEGIASIDYLKEHHAAHVITSKEALVGALREFLDNETLRAEILKNARRLAEQNHDIRHNSRMVYDSLREVCDH